MTATPEAIDAVAEVIYHRLYTSRADARETAQAALEAAAPNLPATPEQMVRQFHAGCQQEGGGWSSATLRHELFMSEVQEFNDAVAANDLVEVADAIADITYVLIGTAIELGIPFDAVFREVHRSNMTKLIPPVVVREDGKVCKGPHFEPPRIAEILADGGPFTPMYKGDPRGGGLPMHQHHTAEGTIDCHVSDCDVYRIQAQARAAAAEVTRLTEGWDDPAPTVTELQRMTAAGWPPETRRTIAQQCLLGQTRAVAAGNPGEAKRLGAIIDMLNELGTT